MYFFLFILINRMKNNNTTKVVTKSLKNKKKITANLKKLNTKKKSGTKKGGTKTVVHSLDLKELEPGIQSKILSDGQIDKHLKVLMMMKILEDDKLTSKLYSLYKDHKFKNTVDPTLKNEQNFFLQFLKPESERAKIFHDMPKYIPRRRYFIQALTSIRRKKLLEKITKMQKEGKLPLWPKRIEEFKNGKYDIDEAIPLIKVIMSQYNCGIRPPKFGKIWWDTLKSWLSLTEAHKLLNITKYKSMKLLEIYKDYIHDYLNAQQVEKKEITDYRSAEYLVENHPELLQYSICVKDNCIKLSSLLSNVEKIINTHEKSKVYQTHSISKSNSKSNSKSPRSS